MANKPFPQFSKRGIMNPVTMFNKAFIFYPAIGWSCLFLAGCASSGGNNHSKPPEATVTPETLSTSYDYTKPGDIDRQSRPVYILPQVTGGWKKARVDDANGEWRSGQYVARVMEPGHWATLEEAELSGKPYITPDGNRPVIPTPIKDQSPTSTGEYNATTIEQKLAKIEKLAASAGDVSRSGGASSTSLGNQAAIPVDSSGKKPEAPNLNIPGLHPISPKAMDVRPKEQPPAPAPAPTPLSLTIPPPTIMTTPNPSGKVQTLETPGSRPGALPAQPPLNLPGNKNPTATYDEKTNSLLVGFGESGSGFNVQTPKGDVKIAYKDGGRVEVTFKNKTESVTITDKTDNVRIELGK